MAGHAPHDKGSALDTLVVTCAALAYGLFTWAGLPAHGVADEIPILKSAYESLAAASLRLQSESAYSAWVHLVQMPGLVLHWLGYWVLNGFPALAEVKRAALMDYQWALVTMRAVNGLFFVFALWLAKRVGDEILGRPFGLWLFALLAGNALILTQAHTIKHWIPAHALVMVALYLAHRGLLGRRLSLRLLAYALFAAAVLLLPVTIFSAPLLLILHLHHRGAALGELGREAGLFVLCALAVYLLTTLLGAGDNVSEGLRGGVRLAFRGENIGRYLRAFALVSPLHAACFVWSVATLWAEPPGRRAVWLLFVACAAAGLLFLAFLGVYGNYYVMLLFFLTAPVAASAPARLWRSRPQAGRAVLTLALAVSLLCVGRWCVIAAHEDTRVQAAAWLGENAAVSGDFVLYDTTSVAYLPLTAETVRLLLEHYPDTVGFRERAVIEHDLPGTVNGIHLWKITFGGHDASAFLRLLFDQGYRVILVHETFGDECNMRQKNPGLLERLDREFGLGELAVFSPYRVANPDTSRIGDILHDFASTAHNLRALARPGPLVRVFEVRAP